MLHGGCLIRRTADRCPGGLSDPAPARPLSGPSPSPSGDRNRGGDRDRPVRARVGTPRSADHGAFGHRPGLPALSVGDRGRTGALARSPAEIRGRGLRRFPGAGVTGRLRPGGIRAGEGAALPCYHPGGNGARHRGAAAD